MVLLKNNTKERYWCNGGDFYDIRIFVLEVEQVIVFETNSQVVICTFVWVSIITMRLS